MCNGFKLEDPEQEGSRRMDKIDLIVIPIVYLLQNATILLHLYLNHGARLYNYWCNTINNQALCKDVMWWEPYNLCSSITLSLYFFHVFLKLIVASVQRNSVWSLLSFWPQFYMEIIKNFKRQSFGRSLPIHVTAHPQLMLMHGSLAILVKTSWAKGRHASFHHTLSQEYPQDIRSTALMQYCADSGKWVYWGCFLCHKKDLLGWHATTLGSLPIFLGTCWGAAWQWFPCNLLFPVGCSHLCCRNWGSPVDPACSAQKCILDAILTQESCPNIQECQEGCQH